MRTLAEKQGRKRRGWPLPYMAMQPAKPRHRPAPWRQSRFHATQKPRLGVQPKRGNSHIRALALAENSFRARSGFKYAEGQ